MNYYERYCGDYQRDTAHLSLCEHGAFTMLLDTYYSTEKPLPADYVSLYRICRAMDKLEQLAVRSVADQFFPILEDGLRHNNRADDMIGKARPKIEAARLNGKKGGRPPKSGNPEETQEEPTGKPTGFSLGNPLETHGQSSPTPTPYKPKNTSSPSRDDAVPEGFAKFWETWPSTERKVAKAKCAEKWRKAGLDTLTDEIVSHIDAMRSTRQWRDGYEPAPLTYLNQRRWEDGVAADSSINGHSDNPFA